MVAMVNLQSRAGRDVIKGSGQRAMGGKRAGARKMKGELRTAAAGINVRLMGRRDGARHLVAMPGLGQLV